MKAISLWQPWATLIAIGAKRIETRSWATSYRGPLAIHAAKMRRKTLDQLCIEPGPIGDALRASGNVIEEGDTLTLTMPIGCIIATCNLVDCVESTGGATRAFLLNGMQVMPPEWHFGDYTPGRFAWLLEDIKPLTKPIKYSGSQRLFRIDRREISDKDAAMLDSRDISASTRQDGQRGQGRSALAAKQYPCTVRRSKEQLQRQCDAQVRFLTEAWKRVQALRVWANDAAARNLEATTALIEQAQDKLVAARDSFEECVKPTHKRKK